VFFLPSISYGQAKTLADSARLNLSKVDSLQNKTTDSINANTQVKQKPNQIDAEINYTAKDSIVFLGNGTGFLHGECDVNTKILI